MPTTLQSVEKKIIPYADFPAEKTAIPPRAHIVLAGGCFDLFHYGHFSFLTQARDLGDFLVIALESDGFIQERKRKEPVHSQIQRARILAAFSFTGLIILLPRFERAADYEGLTRAVHPEIIAVTAGDPLIQAKRAQAAAISAQVREIPHLTGFSSSRLITYASVLGD